MTINRSARILLRLRSMLKPVMTRPAGTFVVFGRNGVMLGQTAMLTLAVMETRNGYLPDAIGRNDLQHVPSVVV
ncbi:hypothetical protein DRA79_26850 (plasmid) [Klebsiella pneumoniae]|nr:hypothetical protein DRA79_26850 [Klebsiella pneumoniae]QHP50401.1 hypothetical protein DRA87_27285 [Klebsiella pneumoniae]RBN08622.1 hypothetical protein DRB13_28025 [Klebsiella pneumoniae]RBN19533.1 hypothetical protein DRB10_28040 [Klebsiella pneumoniae]